MTKKGSLRHFWHPWGPPRLSATIGFSQRIWQHYKNENKARRKDKNSCSRIIKIMRERSKDQERLSVVQVRLFWRIIEIVEFLLVHASNREPDTTNRGLDIPVSTIQIQSNLYYFYQKHREWEVIQTQKIPYKDRVKKAKCRVLWKL